MLTGMPLRACQLASRAARRKWRSALLPSRRVLPSAAAGCCSATPAGSRGACGAGAAVAHAPTIQDRRGHGWSADGAVHVWCGLCLVATVMASSQCFRQISSALLRRTCKLLHRLLHPLALRSAHRSTRRTDTAARRRVFAAQAALHGCGPCSPGLLGARGDANWQDPAPARASRVDHPEPEKQ